MVPDVYRVAGACENVALPVVVDAHKCTLALVLCQCILLGEDAAALKGCVWDLPELESPVRGGADAQVPAGGHTQGPHRRGVPNKPVVR